MGKPERDAALAEASRHGAREHELEARADLRDAEADVLLHLARIRAATAAEVACQTAA
jgi:hypothetical protein